MKKTQQFSSVIANRFVLANDEGIERGVMALDRNEMPFISLNDSNGKSLLSLYICDQDRPWITLTHNVHESSIILTIGEQGEPRIWLYEGSDGDPRAGLLVDKKGNAALEIWGRNSDAGITLNVDASGESRISLCNSDNKTPGIRLKLKTNGEGSLSLYNEKDEKVWSVSSREEMFPGEDKGQQSK